MIAQSSWLVAFPIAGLFLLCIALMAISTKPPKDEK